MFKTISEYVRNDDRIIVMLADIGASGFKDLISEYPDRVLNIGIFEDAMISIAAGCAIKGMIPVVYGITPFIAERALEQLKLDFAFQGLGGIFITTGASYDFSKLGYSHYCPEDAAVIKQIPNLEFIAPGTPAQMECLLRQTFYNRRPTFFRMSDYSNCNNIDVQYEKATVVKTGNMATVIVVSTMLDMVLSACKDFDVTILYYTTLAPFDTETLVKHSSSNKFLICEPELEGTITYDVVKAFEGKPISIEHVGIPREIIRTYGTKKEKDDCFGLTVKNIEMKLKMLPQVL
jgi:transketolase